MRANDIFLAKVRRQEAPRVATGSAVSMVTTDLMDKVGASFPEAHLDAEKMAALAAAGYAEIGFDNIMPLFSVWHESAAIGCAVDWGEKNRMPTGRSICSSISETVSIPADFLTRPACTVPLRAIELLRKRFGDEATITGKVFGPWTLAYHIYGIEEFLIATILQPDRVKQVLDQLVEVTAAFARAQIDSGAHVITVADHCTRDLCSPMAYRDFLMDIHKQLHERIACPILLHICGDTSDRLGYIRQTGIELFHFDSKVPAAEARRLAGPDLALMGGTNNMRIVRDGDDEQIARDVREKIQAGIDIIGPECALPLDAPWRNLRAIASAAKECDPS